MNRLETHFLKTKSTGEQGGGTPVVLQLYQMQLNVPDFHEAARMVVYLALSEELQSAQELVVGQRLETHLSTRLAAVEQRVSTLMSLAAPNEQQLVHFQLYHLVLSSQQLHPLHGPAAPPEWTRCPK